MLSARKLNYASLRLCEQKNTMSALRLIPQPQDFFSCGSMLQDK